MGNDRLIVLCLFAVCQVFVVDVGMGGGGWEGVEPSLMSVWLSLEYEVSFFLLPVVKEWKMTVGCYHCVVHSPTPSWATPLCSGEGGLGPGGGGLVIPL